MSGKRTSLYGSTSLAKGDVVVDGLLVSYTKIYYVFPRTEMSISLGF